MDDYKYLEISKPELEYRIMIALEKIAKSLENYDRKDEPQTEPLPKAINGVKIADAVAWADKWLEDNSVSEMWDMIRTLRDATEWQDEPQTDCPHCGSYECPRNESKKGEKI